MKRIGSFILLLLIVLTFIVILISPLLYEVLTIGDNYMSRLTKIEVPSEVIAIDSTTDPKEKAVIEDYFRDEFIKTAAVYGEGSSRWYADSCFADSVVDYRMESILSINENAKLYFITYFTDRYNFCLEGKESHLPLTRRINFLSLLLDKKDHSIESVEIDSESYYQANKINPADKLYRLFYETKVITLLKDYRYYRSNSSLIKIKSDEFLTNIKNMLNLRRELDTLNKP